MRQLSHTKEIFEQLADTDGSAGVQTIIANHDAWVQNVAVQKSITVMLADAVGADAAGGDGDAADRAAAEIAGGAGGDAAGTGVIGGVSGGGVVGVWRSRK